jgi:hypothetical protein
MKKTVSIAAGFLHAVNGWKRTGFDASFPFEGEILQSFVQSGCIEQCDVADLLLGRRNRRSSVSCAIGCRVRPCIVRGLRVAASTRRDFSGAAIGFPRGRNGNEGARLMDRTPCELPRSRMANIGRWCPLNEQHSRRGFGVLGVRVGLAEVGKQAPIYAGAWAVRVFFQ